MGVNHLYGEPGTPLWFCLPDVAASVILTGRVPKIVDAFRIEPIGTLAGLKPTKLRGLVEVDPATVDFFKVVIEERKRLARRPQPFPAPAPILRGGFDPHCVNGHRLQA